MQSLNKLPALLVIILLAGSFTNKVIAQCCSAGSPAGVGTYAGMVSKKSLRITTFARFTNSSGYYTHDVPLENPVVVKNSNFVFQGLSIAYGLIKGLSLDLDLGYFYLKDQTYVNDSYLKGYGFSNGVFMVKKSIFHSDTARVDLSGGVGLKFPFTTKPLYIDNVRLPIDLQPSTQAFGIAAQLFLKKNLIPYRLSLYFVNRYEYNFRNEDSYRFGDRLRTSLILEANITRQFSTMFQTRFEYGGYDFDFRQNHIFDHSGSYIIYISPLVVYSIASLWHISLSADIPVYKYYNGTQLANKYSIALNLTRDFALSKKHK
jgi:hypothetical protein